MPTNKYANTKDFLNTISQVESSGGQNTNGKVLKHGIHAGTSAIGQYQLMPNTVKELINRRRQDNTITGEMADVDQMSPQDMKAYIEANPDFENDLANGLAKRVLQRQMGDEDKAAYSWKMGHNLNPAEITPDKMYNSSTPGGDYVEKFKRIKNQMNKTQKQDQDENDTQDQQNSDDSEDNLTDGNQESVQKN